MTFWILSTLMAVLAMGFVCFPLLSAGVSSRNEFDSEQTFYRARISEIEKDLELGRLDSDSADAAKAEEARRLIKTSEKTSAISLSRGNKGIVILAALSLPIFTIPLYYYVGSPHVTSISSESSEPSTELSMQELLEIAEKRLKSSPNDVNGWKVIAPVYMRLGRFDDALNAYENILRVNGRTPEYIIKMVDAYIEKHQGQINEQASVLISEVLSIDEDNAIAKFYTGIIALQADNEDETMRIWQDMVDNANGTEEWLPTVIGRIEELKKLEPLAALPKVGQDTIKAAEELEPQVRSAMIGEMVARLAKRLEENPDDKTGWERLIRSYLVLGRTEDAQAAVLEAKKQYKNDKEYLDFLNGVLNLQNSFSNGEAQ